MTSEPKSNMKSVTYQDLNRLNAFQEDNLQDSGQKRQSGALYGVKDAVYDGRDTSLADRWMAGSKLQMMRNRSYQNSVTKEEEYEKKNITRGFKLSYLPNFKPTNTQTQF